MSTPTLAPTAPPCVDCGTTGGGFNGGVSPWRARGLCNTCYKRQYARGKHEHFPATGRVKANRDQVLDMWVELRDTQTRDHIAQRLGISRRAFDRHISRARSEGDPRAAEPQPEAAEPEQTGDMRWQARGKCREHDPELWFAVDGTSIRAAKAICRTCPVAAECLEWALANRPAGGVWGGEEFSDTGRVWNRRRSA